MYALSNRLNGYSPSNDIVHAIRGVARKLKSSYSYLPMHVHSAIRDHLPARSDLRISRQQLDDATHTILHALKNTKLFLILGGAGYALFASCRYCKKEHIAERMHARIRRRPIQASLVALGVGLIIGRIL